MRVLVAVAWPYANGPLHLGHVAGSLLPPDIFARYQRLRGHDVLMVSGSDMHGTPITVAAEKAGEPPEAFAEKNHVKHVAALEALGIAFNLFTSTATANHRETVHEVFLQLRESGYIEERTMTSPYDAEAQRFLPDRYVEGTCPHCGFKDARGDQCDECGRTLDPQELLEPRSKLTGSRPEYRQTDHYFLLLTQLQDDLATWVDAQSARANWRPTVVNFTQNWLKEGLKDRPITRDLTYGVPIPAEVGEHPDKRIYVWFEAVIGYLSAAREWAHRAGDDDAWRRWWVAGAADGEEQRHYYFLGKDNTPFHTIIWPSMITGANRARGEGDQLLLPWDVPANEFLQMRGAKFSKSRGNAFYVLDLLETFSADQVRYYLAVNMPERGDTDWTWQDFTAKVNDELVGTLGNYVNRVLTFCANNFDGIPPDPGDAVPADRWAPFQEEFLDVVEEKLAEVAEAVEAVELKRALRTLVAISGHANQSIQGIAPWDLVKQGDDGKAQAAQFLRAHLQVIKALAVSMSPFLPHASRAIWNQLGDAGEGVDPMTASETSAPGVDRWPATLPPIPDAGRLGDVGPVFGKLDPAEVLGMFSDEKQEEATPVQETTTDDTPTATIDDFAKLELRVGRVTSVADHPKADRLYVLKVDLGTEERQIVAGLKGLVPPEELEGRRVVLIANLKPAVLRGVESQGMLLAAEDADGNVAPLTPAGEVALGAKVR